VLRVVRVLAPNPGVFELEGTNTWVVGPPPAIVIDPGPEDERHLREVGRTAVGVGAILLTHDHPDHAPGALRLAGMTGAPVHAARPVDGMERMLDGGVVRSGAVSLSAIATPGHSSDHLAFFEGSDGALFTGDAVLGRGTSVIDPPEGDLAAYLRSLRRMRELSPRTIYPGHGPVVTKGYLDVQRAHLLGWKSAVADAVAKGWSRDETVARVNFADEFGPVDIGQEYMMDYIQTWNAGALWDKLTGSPPGGGMPRPADPRDPAYAAKISAASARA